MRITARINTSYHEPEEIRRLFSELIGKPLEESFCLFPPFSTDFGKNISIGKKVFINAGCRFQDHGGITIVAAGAVVTRNVPANVIVGGVPAKIIRRMDSVQER